jgi:hypothetical protein
MAGHHAEMAKCFKAMGDHARESEDDSAAECCDKAMASHLACGEKHVEFARAMSAEMAMVSKSDLDSDEMVPMPAGLSAIYKDNSHVRAVSRVGQRAVEDFAKIKVAPGLEKIFGTVPTGEIDE